MTHAATETASQPDCRKRAADLAADAAHRRHLPRVQVVPA